MPTSPQKALRERIARYATQRAAALDLGISQAYLSDLLNGRRGFSDAVLEKLGLETITTFRRKKA